MQCHWSSAVASALSDRQNCTCAKHYKHNEDGRTARGVCGDGSVPPSHTGNVVTRIGIHTCSVIYRLVSHVFASPQSHIRDTCNSLTTKKQTTQLITSANFKKMVSPSYIILRIQRLAGKQYRSWWGGSSWATSSRSTLFANSAIFEQLTHKN